MTVLTDSEIRGRIQNLKQWFLSERGEIEKKFEFKNFKESLSFVNAVGFFAEKANHHPDILVNYNKVTLSLMTHDAGGITEKDFQLVTQINELYD